MNSSQGADRTDFNNRQSNKSTIFANSPSVDERNPYKSGETLVTINRYRTTSAEMISEAKKYLNKMTTHGPNPNALPSNGKRAYLKDISIILLSLCYSNTLNPINY